MIYDTKISGNIYKASESLLNGEIIIYPTDTLYGFGVNAKDHYAINKLNKLKKRIQPYSIIVNSIKMLRKYVLISTEDELKINKFFPGPYTMIFNKNKNCLSPLITLNLNTIAVRIPKHNFALKIVSSIDSPIVTTSVNIHNDDPLFDILTIKFVGVHVYHTSVCLSSNKLDIFFLLLLRL